MNHGFKTAVVALILAVGFTASVAAGALDDAAAAIERNDYTTAFRLLRPFADQGHAAAQRVLGNMYASGQGVAQDYAEAAKWYRKAADQGDLLASVALGLMYSAGQGVTQDYAEAVKWLHKPADQGNAIAQYNLGVAYEKGQGVRQVYAEAVKWFQKAADQGYARAQFNLGVMYDEGQGAPRNKTEAVKWYWKAADQGDYMAQFNVGAMYANGQGVRRDLVQAYMWFSLSGAQGDQKAIMARDMIARDMTPAQIADAQRLARKWTSSTTTMPATTTVPGTTTTTTPAGTTEHNLFWDSVVAGLKVLTYWQTYVAGLEYLAIFFIPMAFAGMIMERSRSVAGGAVGCFTMLLMPILQIAAMAVFTLTLSPIIFGFAEDANWSFPWKVITLAPGAFLKLLGALVVVSFGMAFIPLLGRMQSLQTFVLGGIALTFVLGLLEAINPGGFLGHIEFIPDFWFVVGLLVIGGLISWIGTLVAAVVASPIEMMGEGLGTLFVMPIAAIFGFVPMFIYGAWLGAQIRGGL